MSYIYSLDLEKVIPLGDVVTVVVPDPFHAVFLCLPACFPGEAEGDVCFLQRRYRRALPGRRVRE